MARGLITAVADSLNKAKAGLPTSSGIPEGGPFRTGNFDPRPRLSDLLSDVSSRAHSVSQTGNFPSNTWSNRGQGMVSNIRHGVGTSLARDAIAQWLNPISAKTGDPNLFTRGASNIGAWLGGALYEIPDFIKAIQARTPSPWVQPWEDILANTMGLRNTDYYTSPQTKATNLASTYTTDTGKMNTMLQNLSGGPTGNGGGNNEPSKPDENVGKNIQENIRKVTKPTRTTQPTRQYTNVSYQGDPTGRKPKPFAFEDVKARASRPTTPAPSITPVRRRTGGKSTRRGYIPPRRSPHG